MNLENVSDGLTKSESELLFLKMKKRYPELICFSLLSAIAVLIAGCHAPEAKTTEKASEKPATPVVAATQPVLTDGDVHQDVRALTPRNGNATKIDKDLRAYLSEKKLKPNQQTIVLNALAGNAVWRADDTLWKGVLNTVYAISDEKEKIRQISEILRLQMTKWVTEQIAIERLEALYRKHIGQIAPNYAAGVLMNLGDLSIRILNDEAKFNACYKELCALNVPEAHKAQYVHNLLSPYVKYDPAAAEKCFKKYGIPMPSRSEFLESYITCSVKDRNRKLFDRTLKEIQAMPEGKQKNDLLVHAATQFGEVDGMEKVLSTQKGLSYQNQWDLLNSMLQRSVPNGLARTGFSIPHQYEKYKAIAIRIDSLMVKQDEKWAKGDKSERPTSDYSKMGVYANVANNAFLYGDYDFSEKMVAKIPKDFAERGFELRVKQNIFRGNYAAAAAEYESVLKNPKASSRDKDFATVFIYFLKGGTAEKFDAAFAARKFTSAEKMNLIRRCSKFYFNGKRFDKARELEQFVMKTMLKAPETHKIYTVQWVDIAPSSAGAWILTPDFKDWSRLDTRFLPYSGYGQDNATDTNHLLKDAKVSLKEEYKVGTQLLCDDSGLHLYVRCDDPDVASIRTGKRSYGTIEGVFQPGFHHPYHWFMIENLPASTTAHNPDWATASKHYCRSEDSIRKDATITETGVAAHFFFPWLSFWDKLPAEDNVWRYGLQIWGPDSRSSSGLVHELHRTIRLDFRMTPAQEIALKRQVAHLAFYRYDKIRKDKGGIIQTWNDPVLGDPAFYKAEVEPLINMLDEAGKKLVAPAKDTEIAEIYTNFVPLWAEIKYVLAEKREKYIKQQLFK